MSKIAIGFGFGLGTGLMIWAICTAPNHLVFGTGLAMSLGALLYLVDELRPRANQGEDRAQVRVKWLN